MSSNGTDYSYWTLASGFPENDIGSPFATALANLGNERYLLDPNRTWADTSTFGERTDGKFAEEPSRVQQTLCTTGDGGGDDVTDETLMSIEPFHKNSDVELRIFGGKIFITQPNGTNAYRDTRRLLSTLGKTLSGRGLTENDVAFLQPGQQCIGVATRCRECITHRRQCILPFERRPPRGGRRSRKSSLSSSKWTVSSNKPDSCVSCLNKSECVFDFVKAKQRGDDHSVVRIVRWPTSAANSTALPAVSGVSKSRPSTATA